MTSTSRVTSRERQVGKRSLDDVVSLDEEDERGLDGIEERT